MNSNESCGRNCQLSVNSTHSHRFTAQQARKRQAPKYVVSHSTSRISDEMNLTEMQPERGEHIYASVHTGHDRESTAGAWVRDMARAAAYALLSASSRPTSVIGGVLLVLGTQRHSGEPRRVSVRPTAGRTSR